MTCRSESRDELRAEISRDGPSLVCRQNHTATGAACRPTRKHAELEPRGAELDWHLDVVPRAEAHLRRVVPLLRLRRQLRVPLRVCPPCLRRTRERREYDQVGRQLHAVELVGGVLRLLLADIVERVVGLVHVPLVHAWLRVAGRLSVPAVDEVKAQRQPLRLEIRAERNVPARHIDRQPDRGGLGGQRGLVHLV